MVAWSASAVKCQQRNWQTRNGHRRRSHLKKHGWKEGVCLCSMGIKTDKAIWDKLDQEKHRRRITRGEKRQKDRRMRPGKNSPAATVSTKS